MEEKLKGLEKIVAIIGQLSVNKDRNNNFGKYKYRNAEDILTALKPLCTLYKVFVKISDSIEFVNDRYYVKSTVQVIDAEDGGKVLAENSAYAREPLETKGMSDGQITGSTSSYARKYALAGMFNLSPAEDMDEHVTLEQLSDTLYKRGIDPSLFVFIMFGYNELIDIRQAEIDSVANHIDRFIELFPLAHAKYIEVNLRDINDRFNKARVDTEDFWKRRYGHSTDKANIQELNEVMSNFAGAVKWYKGLAK